MMTDELDGRFLELRARLNSADPLLNLLINLVARGDSSTQIGVVLVTGGAAVRGIPSISADFAFRLDEEIRWYYMVMRALAAREAKTSGGTANKGFFNDVIDGPLGDFFSRYVENQSDDERKIIDYLNDLPEGAPKPKLWEFPPELTDAALTFSTPPKAVSIQNAQVSTHGGEWQEVESCRVVLAQVEAWWTFRLNAPAEVAEDLT